ncbi:MAG TPA: AmmeMemoRadiSam system protein A [Methylophilaceae bacterium]|nr:AmmeMemoRadiSam system protein A [Methylophilaceae bacterium]
MTQTIHSASSDAGKVLIPIARASIAQALGKPHAKTKEDLPWLQDKGASFVTLTQNEQLRGCIGTLEAHRPLLIDVKANAYAAAFHDPRFSPLSSDELDDTQIEISLLSAMQAIAFANESDALAQLQPGVDGIVLEFGHYRSTFLPQVWEQLPDARLFMAHLKHKAGLSPEFWDEELKLYRYTVSKWREKDITNEVEVLTKYPAT